LTALATLSAPAGAAISGPLTIDFENLTLDAFAGKANAAPAPGGACNGTGFSACHLEDGMVVGTVTDTSNPIAHLHRHLEEDNTLAEYHSDSAGLYVRALDGGVFRLESMHFEAPIDVSENPGQGVDDVWEILGFSTATNPDLDTGNGTDYPTRVAYQTVSNGFDGVLVLDPAFGNIAAFWIHYKGYPQTPADGRKFGLHVDDIQISAVPVPAAAWWMVSGLAGLAATARRHTRQGWRLRPPRLPAD
jgi:hypothetical protein